MISKGERRVNSIKKKYVEIKLFNYSDTLFNCVQAPF